MFLLFKILKNNWLIDFSHTLKFLDSCLEIYLFLYIGTNYAIKKENWTHTAQNKKVVVSFLSKWKIPVK